VSTRWVRAEAQSAAAVRHEIARELLSTGVAPGLVDDAVLVASELVGNSIRHARALPSGQLTVAWERREGGITIRVTDGGGRQHPQVRTAAATDPTGRGLSIVAALTDFWGVSYGPGTVTVWAHLPTHRATKAAGDQIVVLV
jgi:anti-sigma regulatory factor (Ser/Thr protein kinase)